MHLSTNFSHAFSDAEFKVAIRSPWRYTQHINIFELEAAVLAVRYMERSPVTRDHRVQLFIDNM